MCRSPIRIRNPNKGIKNLADYNNNTSNINLYIKDVTCTFIDIPCGKCPDCIRLRQSYLVQRTICETFDNDLYFATFTYNNEMLPSININGYDLKYADIKHVQDMMKRVRKNYDLPSFRYLCVSEFGKSTNRPHFHILFSFPKVDKELIYKYDFASKLWNIFLTEWRVNLGSTRVPIYKPLCTYISNKRGRNFDLHYVNPSSTTSGISDVAYYVTKYILKVNPYVDSLKSALYYNIPDYDLFKEVWQKIRPRFLLSKHYGNPNSDFTKKHIRDCIDFSLDSNFCYPVFLHPDKPQSYPLCPYYRNRFLTISDKLKFLDNTDSPFDDAMILSEDFDPIEFVKTQADFENIKTQVLDSDSYCDDSMTYDNDFVKFTEDYIGVPIVLPKLDLNFNYESSCSESGFE